MLWIRTQARKTIRLRFNEAQRKLYEAHKWQRDHGMPVRIIICKSRRAGLSTGVEALIFDDTVTHADTTSLIVSHMINPSENVLGMCRTFWEHMPAHIRFKTPDGDVVMAVKPPLDKKYQGNMPSDKIEFAPDLRSRIFIASAKSLDAYRSFAFQNIHATEAAHYDDAADLFTALSATVPDEPETSLYIESTPNGMGGKGEWFYEQCLDAQLRGRHPKYGEMMLVFIPWHEMPLSFSRPFDTPENRVRFERGLTSDERDLIRQYPTISLEQLNWRRVRLSQAPYNKDEERFLQEYPCVTGDTLVGTDTGVKPIAEITGGVTASGKITGWKDNGLHDCVRVQTSMGYTVDCTYTHPLALATGGFIPGGSSIESEIRLQAPLLAGEPYTEKWDVLPTVKAEMTITRDVARFLGYFMGDGSVYGSTIEFACNAVDTDVVQDITTLMERLFGMKMASSLVGTNKGCRRLRASSVEAVDTLERLGCIKMGNAARKRKVCIPRCIWRSPGTVVREFLRALFEADGWVSATNNTVKFFTNDERFGRDVQTLLLAMHIHCNRRLIYKYKDGVPTYPGYEITLWSLDAQLFCKEIGFLSARKNKRTAPKTRAAGRKPRDVNYRDTVISVTPIGHHRVYDLQIKDTSVFDANGILVHNTDLATCFLTSGTMVFSRVALQRLMMNVRPPLWEGDIYWGESDAKNQYEAIYNTIRRPKFLAGPDAEAEGFESHVVDRTYNNLKVWRWPNKGDNIIIGCDIGAGNPRSKDGDFSTICVLATNTMERDELIMTWRGKLNPIAFADVCAALAWGIRYKVGDKVVAPKLVPEWTGPGTATCTEIDTRKLYEVDHYRMPGVAGMPKSKHIGWESNAKTKPFAVGSMVKMVEQNLVDIPSEQLVLEMASYKQHGAMADETSFGSVGTHDDLVSSFQIALAVSRLDAAIDPGEAQEAFYVDLDTPVGETELEAFDEFEAKELDQYRYGTDDDDDYDSDGW
jgi:hypothetical protein